MINWDEIATTLKFVGPKEMFVKMYITDKKSLPEIAAKLGCSVNALRQQLDRHGVPTRRPGGETVKRSGVLANVTKEEYDKVGARELARRHDLDVTTVYKYFRRKSAPPTSGSDTQPEGEALPEDPRQEP